MKLVRRLLILFASLTICQSPAMAETDSVKICPKNGEPMIVTNFNMGWSDVLSAEWNKQQIDVPIRNIKSIRFRDSQPKEGEDANLLDAEVTMKTGEKSRMKIENAMCNCETQFGKLRLAMADIISLDFEPDLDSPEAIGTPPARKMDGGAPSVGKP